MHGQQNINQLILQRTKLAVRLRSIKRVSTLHEQKVALLIITYYIIIMT